MPMLPLVRLPLPNLRTYAVLSTTLFVAAVFHIRNWIGSEPTPAAYDNNGLDFFDLFLVVKDDYGGQLKEKMFLFLRTMMKEPWCLVALINQAYCCLIIFGKIIQKIVFGQLRIIEQQHAKDKFWNFVFYKFIYIFGVMNVQELEEIVLWFSWFSVLGFLHILATLSKDRFEYNSSSPSIARKAHWKVLSLLTYLHLFSWSLLVLSIYFWIHYVSINTFAFMMAESLMLIIKTLYVLVRYGIHLRDTAHEGTWENRAVLVYYSDFVFEVSALLIDFCHHLHMLLYGNIFLSMASLVIGMQLRYLFYELRRRIKRHENYRRVVSSMETKFPMATSAELKENNDDCAICWEKMDTARKLPCGHVFHNTCLRSWLEQDTTCPTCRLNLRELQRASPVIHHRGMGADNNDDLGDLRGVTLTQGHRQTEVRVGQTSPPIVPTRRAPAVNGRRTSYFHFDGSRILSWLPSFSVEVTQSNLLSGMFGQTSTIDNMVRQVRDIFPNYPASVVRDDIRVTRSVEMTIDNIVEGRLVIPEGMRQHDDRDSSLLATDIHHHVVAEETEGTPLRGNFDTAAALLSDLSSDVQAVRVVYESRNDDEDDDENVDDNNTTSLSQLSSTFSERDTGIAPPDSTNTSPQTSAMGGGGRGVDELVSDGIGMGFRFSKSSVERENMLQLRKKKLVDDARRKYLEKNNLLSTTSSTPSHGKTHSKSSTSHHSQEGRDNRSGDDSLESTDEVRLNQSSNQSHAFRRRFFSRNRTEGSPVDVVEFPPRNGIFRFISQ